MTWNIPPDEKDEDVPKGMEGHGMKRWSLRNPAYIEME